MSDPRPPESLFRKRALERLSSPEQLDQLIAITRPAGWLSLLTIWLFLGCVVAWGFLGELPEVVQGRGMLIGAEGLRAVPAPVRGQLTVLRAREGAEVRAGDVVAEVRPYGEETSTVEVTATDTGRVAQVVARIGSLVEPGDLILTVSLGDSDSDAVLYIPVDVGKKVVPGMEARLKPSTVNAEEYGFLLATVASVGSYPSTALQMREVLGTPELVASFQRGDSLYQSALLRVDCRLERTSDTVSGYRWSTQDGPPLVLSPGTVCSAEIVTEYLRPIDLVLPDLRRRLGVPASQP